MKRSNSRALAHSLRDPVSCTSEDSIGFLIKCVLVSMSRIIERDMVPLDLTAMQWRPLMMVYSGKADTAAELARVLDVDTGAMTRTLDRLEGKGLLRRERSQDDRRVVRLELTDAGREVAAQCPAVLGRMLDHHLRDFKAEEVTALRAYLQRMLVNGAQPRA
ncbi:MarR family transcriptional regulator [Corticimicrobacter populi]|uniref:MarR family transcriptional regulator n=2 Tax=Corticimicrobacter populi TaxID=2175229 RepID=A0A2V1JZY7_9BURK|nr:MarR family transcriptional regulator [Corticimicrobacter populi]PWF21825.1 MarR family transcriptional regulator [Corticimicrobacter populi]